MRPSNGRLVVSPSDWIYGIHEWTGTDFVQLPGNDGTLDLVEDSGGRLWAAGGATFGLSYYTGAGWTPVPGAGAGTRLKKDPTRSSTVWAADDYNIVRTDGTDSFARTIADFPGSAAWFTGLAPDTGGVSWIGTWSQFTQTGSTLIRLDANTGAFQTWRHDQGWPFPGEHVRPHAVTPDGRLWMQYDSEYPSNRNGICWWDGTTVVAFPAPPGGVPQWGGLPNSTVEDFAVREIPGGYELWMACLGRGIAVLTVQHPTAVTPPAEAPAFALAPNAPNPFRSSTRVHFSLPRAGHVRLSVLDVSGRVVRTLLDGETTAGRHDAEWDGRDATGRSVSSGVYFCEIQGAGQSLRQRMIKLN